MLRIALMLAAALVASSVSAAEVGVSVTVGQPGFYGHIDIGNFPSPRLIYDAPIVVEHVHVDPRPVFLHVPPGHAKHWNKHCHEYGACSRQVYFVESSWYEEVYVPEYQKRHPGRGKAHQNR